MMVYRHYTDTSNYEGVDCQNDGPNMRLTWIANGTGSMRRPVAKTDGARIVVSFKPHSFVRSCLVEGGADLPVEFEDAA